MSFLRLAMMLGILNALFLAVGLFFAGIAGMTIGLLIALAMNVLAYWYSDSFVLRLYGAKPYENRKLMAVIDKLAKKHGIPKPKLYFVNTDVPNAFATGRSPKRSAVAVTRGLMDKLDDSEVEAVLAHELSHVKHRDTLVSTMAATLGGALTWFAYLFWFGSDERNRNALSYVLLFILAPLAAMLVRLSITRSREYLADRGGAGIADPLKLASALEKISASVKERPMRGNAAASHLFIVNPFSAGNIAGLFSTHPSTESRVERLKAMSKEMANATKK